jgi:Peptidase family M48
MRCRFIHVLIVLAFAGVPAFGQPAPSGPQPAASVPAASVPAANAPAAMAPATTAPATMALEDIVRRASQSETSVVVNLKVFKPIVEVYMQNVVPDEASVVTPNQDAYFLGRFNWRNGPRLQTFSGAKDEPRMSLTSATGKSFQYPPDGFAAMVAPDWEALDSGRYTFALVRREFVGETRCFVIDVRPKRNARDGFSGRIWVEDRDFNIVRFNGINTRVEREFFHQVLSFHVDSWRSNVLPGLWLPSYVYVEEIDTGEPASTIRKAHLRSQVRLWGYDPREAHESSAFTDILIDAPQVQDNARQGQLSSVLSSRQWEAEAEANVLERLDKARLLATSGEVEKVLETVINNLEVTNDLTLDHPVTVRVLLTAPFESFTIGHTIVLSRGLIDVLPDEASLAMMLAHELAHVVLRHPLIDTQFAFGDRLMVGDEELLRLLKVKRTAKEEAAADTKVLEMLDKSPYKDKLADSGLFLKIVAARARQLPNLIQPHIGDHIAEGGQIMRLTQVMQAAPELNADQLDQIAALPLGARLVLDPWSSRLELIRNAAQLPGSAREKVPLAISPLIPYVKYVNAPPLFQP